MINDNVNLADEMVLKLWTQSVANHINVENWHEIGATGEPAFVSGFTNTASRETAAYRRTKWGLMSLKGNISHTNLNGVVAFTLTKVDYLPKVQIEVSCAVYNGAWVGGMLSIGINGDVIVTGSGTITKAVLNSNFYT